MSDSNRFQRLETLFHQLEGLAAEQRQSRLEALAAEDRALHDELLQMLEPDDRLESGAQALESMAGRGGVAASLGAEDNPTLRDPDQVGPYRLVRQVGEGGMGRVYLAEQEEPVQRRVALKLTRRGLDSEEAIIRFRAERQALAVLEHPNIASVFDAGSLDDGRPWFAMEFIEGVPITQWAADRKLGLTERIELLLPVCEAVQHAHRKGLIHRDLKPSNILVVDQGGTGVPKVIDFGIARAMDFEADDGTRVTRLGELVGTPEYMSPEQAALGEVDVDTRSDVYSLGLMLYELLVGGLPVSGRELRDLGFEAMCRQIREGETPRPSRVPTDPVTTDLTTQRWRSRLKGDLDSVLLKALAKDRNRRYGSADDLADDLRRYLSNEPVVAQPPSLGYRAGKFIKRHRWPVAAGSAVASALLIGTVLASYGLLQARDSEQRALAAAEQAESERQAAEETTAFLVDLFRAADPANDPGLEATAEDLLGRGEVRIDQLEGQPGVQAELLASLGSAYSGLGELNRSEALLQRARALRDAGEAADAYKRAAIDSRLADLLRERSAYADAVDYYRSALETLRSLDRFDNDDEIVLLNGLGVSLVRTNDTEGAERAFQRALALVQELPETDDAALAARQNHRLNLQSGLTSLYAAQGRYAEAATATRDVLAVLSSILPETHPNIAILHTNLSVMLAAQGELVDADREAQRSIELSRESLGADHPRTAIHLLHAGTVQWRLGKFAGAESSFREAIDISILQHGESHPELVRPRTRLALVLMQVNRLDEAAAEADIAMNIGAANSDAVPIGYRLEALQSGIQIELARNAPSQARALLGISYDLDGLDSEDQGRLKLLEARINLAESRTDRAAALLQEAEDLSGCDAEPCVLDAAAKGEIRAAVLAGIGPSERAIETLAYAARHPDWTHWLISQPMFDSLRDNPQLIELQRLLAQKAEMSSTP
ncbi:MAG: protein kinase [Pseudomonadota bacterium]